MPAPTMARIASQSAAACARSGTKPACSHAVVVICDQGPLLPKIHCSPARSASRSPGSSASGCPAGSATSSGSASSATRVNLGSRGVGACAASESARSTLPSASSSYASAASASRTDTARPGCEPRSSRTAGTTSAGIEVENAPTRTSPASPWR